MERTTQNRFHPLKRREEGDDTLRVGKKTSVQRWEKVERHRQKKDTPKNKKIKQKNKEKRKTKRRKEKPTAGEKRKQNTRFLGNWKERRLADELGEGRGHGDARKRK